MSNDRFSITFIDSGREPQCAPNPVYPRGMEIDMSKKGLPSCTLELPYPAPRCGSYVIKCSRCDQTVALTVAGRIDDPRLVKLACMLARH